MSKRTKSEQLPLLKARDFDNESDVLLTATILQVRDIHTKFNEEGENSTLVDVQDEKTDSKFSLFVNQSSMNNLIDAFGDDDKNWLNKMVKVVCNTDNYLKSKQLVIIPLK